MPILKLSKSIMRDVPEVGKNIYIIENKTIEDLLFNRSCIGIDFTRKCERASSFFLKHFEAELGNQGESLAEMMILSKGLYYWFHNAFDKCFNKNLQTNFVSTNRVKVAGNEAHILISYFNFDAPADKLLIGDTIASGATICAALSSYLKVRELKKVYIFSLVGSRIGVERIINFCQERGIELFCAFGLALFGLGENGFDLSFLHPDTITNSKYIKRATKVFRGLPISVAGWDFGSQAQSLSKYRMLSWLEAKKWSQDDNVIFSEIEVPNSLTLIKKERDAYKYLPLPEKISK